MSEERKGVNEEGFISETVWSISQTIRIGIRMGIRMGIIMRASDHTVA